MTGQTLEWGRAAHRNIYKASANSEVFGMLAAYCADVEYALAAVGFGLFMADGEERGG